MKAENLFVKAAPGTWAPKEGYGQGRITDSTPEPVPNNRYYRRLILDGSIYTVDSIEPVVEKETEKVNEKKAGKK